MNLRRCSHCKSAFYCSREHQRSDWRNHRTECKTIRSQIDSGQFQLQQNQPLRHPNYFQQPIDHGTAAQSFDEGGAGWQQQPTLHNQHHGLLDISPANQPDMHLDAEEGGNGKDAAMPMVLEQPRSGASFQVAAAQLQADREKKVRDFRNLTENTMRINDVHLTNAANVMAR